MPRKLVTVRRVSALDPIPGADRIQRATVDGWSCIVSVGDFRAGDLGLYFEIDSFLPAADPRWAVFDGKFTVVDGVKGMRVKTIKLKRVLSQGLLMPLSKFPEVVAAMDRLERETGRDEMEKQIRGMSFEDMLGVRKWEPPANTEQGASDMLAEFPVFIPKTDQERLQNIPDVFDSWGDAIFQETTKMDGSSMTVYFIRNDSPHYAYLPTFPARGEAPSATLSNGRVGVCSRNRDIAPDAKSNFWYVALRHDLPARLNALDRNIAVQGELCGSSIQANFEGFERGFHDLFLFSVWDVDAQRYLPPRDVHEVWAPKLGLQHVRVDGYCPLRALGSSVADLLERAEGTGVNGRKREGIVLKHVDGEFSFKAISNSYLLKHRE